MAQASLATASLCRPCDCCCACRYVAYLYSTSLLWALAKSRIPHSFPPSFCSCSRRIKLPPIRFPLARSRSFGNGDPRSLCACSRILGAQRSFILLKSPSFSWTHRRTIRLRYRSHHEATPRSRSKKMRERRRTSEKRNVLQDSRTCRRDHRCSTLASRLSSAWAFRSHISSKRTPLTCRRLALLLPAVSRRGFYRPLL